MTTTLETLVNKGAIIANTKGQEYEDGQQYLLC